MSSLWLWKNGQMIDSNSTGTFAAPNWQCMKNSGADKVTGRQVWTGNGKYESHRIPGRYALGHAKGEVTFDPAPATSEKWPGVYVLEAQSKSLEDLMDLYIAIRGGKILPSVSYEEKQVDNPIRQFRDLVREFFYLMRIHLRSRFFSRS